MMPLANEKPAGGNLRVGDVVSTTGGVIDGTEGTPENANRKLPSAKTAPTAEQWQAFDDAVAALAAEPDDSEGEACTVAVVDRLREFDVGDQFQELASDEAIDLLQQLSLPADRDDRDNRDVASGAAPEGPGQFAPSRGSRYSRTGARFELIVSEDDLRDGVHWIGLQKEKGDEPPAELPPVWVCSPLAIRATTRDGAGNEWGRLLVFFDRDGREHRWAMPMAKLAGSGEEVRAELMRQGLEITSDTAHRTRLSNYIQWASPDIAARCVSRTGWDGDVFVLPHCTYGDDDAQPVIFQTSAPDGIALAQAGTLQSWREHVAAPCAGNTRLVLALSTAFAAPCMGLIGAEGGGLHLRGGSSTGKSTALYLAASVCGPPQYARSWRQTDNGLEGVASLHSDLPLVLDELGQLEPKAAGHCAYLLANGQGKGRANRDGLPRAAATFRVLFLSAGEIGLAELVAEGGGRVRAGQEVRVLDIPADAGARQGVFDVVPGNLVAGAFAEQLRAAAAKHYGHALPAFLAALVADIGLARDVLRRQHSALADEIAAGLVDGQVRRAARRFALVAMAGELATHYGLTGWPRGEATHAAKRCFAAWLDARGTKGNAEPAAMRAQVMGFLETYGEARFLDWDVHGTGPFIAKCAGYRKRVDQGYEYFIYREAFRTEIAAGFDHQAVAQALLDCGALMGEADGTTRTERLPNGRRTRVYRVTPALWEVEG